MNQQIKLLIKKFIPPILLDCYKSRTISQYGFFGNYSSWQEAEKDTLGYDADIIIEKVKSSLLKVKNGEAIYERDSVLFAQIWYSWPTLAGILWVASQSNNRLDIIDFGGSLGSTYFQNRKFLSHIQSLRWNIVEQQKFVEYGKKLFQDEHLKFYYNISECLGENQPNLFLFSSVLQYLEEPYLFLQEILAMNIEYIIFDRTTFINDKNDRITIQRIPPSIYSASYPAWFFNKDKFLGLMNLKYELITDFEALGGKLILEDGKEAKHLGFIFKLREV